MIEAEISLDGPVDIGRISLACTLSWLAFRDLPWFGDRHPRLAAWFEAFSHRLSMTSTPLSGQTHDQ